MITAKIMIWSIKKLVLLRNFKFTIIIMISIGGMEQVFLCNQVGERGSVFGAPLLLVVIIFFFVSILLFHTTPIFHDFPAFWTFPCKELTTCTICMSQLHMSENYGVLFTMFHLPTFLVILQYKFTAASFAFYF